MSEVVLHAEHVSMAFGGLKALTDFNLELRRGDLQGLIGPNGAGKTTLFNVLTGIYKPTAGTITLAGRRISGLSPHVIVETGMSRTFQNIRLFRNLTVLDNVRVAFHVRRAHNFFGMLARSPLHLCEEHTIKKEAMRLLSIVKLDHRAHDLAPTLPYGDQRRLEIARALAARPIVLLLDEPAAGLNTQEKLDLALLIRRLRTEFDLTILLIEHDMGMVMDLCERITVIDYGVTIAQGLPAEIQTNPKVIEAYLGAEVPAEVAEAASSATAPAVGGTTHGAA